MCVQCWGDALPAAICCRGVPCSGVILGVTRGVAGMSVCVGQGEELHEPTVNQGTASSWKLANPDLQTLPHQSYASRKDG